ncbi:MAG TPA: methionine/alanine import family NSS transporter small subunit [Intrasporangium sp.]|nr:methionine/alanine import family NSS transporter small subunit [Intrasporangium sp.]HKX66131.1 methionine/alanine import family NSS transporter small subunit [Intrasporangium sp.]
MSTGAIVMMAIAILVVWGGLVVAILNLRRGDTEEMIEHRDL